MKPKLQERGQSLVLIALSVIGLFGFSALAIDGSRVFSARRNAQNAADTAALAAALARIRQPDPALKGAAAVNAAENRALTNGYVDGANSTVVEVHMCDETGLTPPCEGLPGGATRSEYVQVKINRILPATFGRIVGRNTFDILVTAIAHAEDSIPEPLFDGAALVTLKPDGEDTFTANGAAYLDVQNSGVFNNSTTKCGMSVVGAGEYHVDTAFQLAGAYDDDCESGHYSFDGPIQSTLPVPYPPTITVPIPDIVCSGNGSYTVNGDTVTYTPGNFPSGINVNSTQYVNFDPGNYCFGGSVTINGSATVNANDVNMSINSGAFSIAGGSSFTCNNALFHIDGGSGMTFNGNGGTFCNNVTFIASTGTVSWQGNVENRLFAPTGGLYEDVLIYMPYGNTSPLSLNGNSDNQFTGTIMAIQAPIRIDGNSGTSGLHSQIIGWTVELQGSSHTTIFYDPDEQYAQVDPSAITLTK
jgi:putative Flp pilus-assembly TadE/G-like protein